MIENKTNKKQQQKNKTKNTAFNSSKTKRKCRNTRRQQHINKTNMDYPGLELASQRSASIISLLCVTNCATTDCMIKIQK